MHPTIKQYNEMLTAYHAATSEAERKFILEKVVNGMYLLAIKVAKRYCYSNKAELFDDGIQACLIGVVKAANKFDPKVGAAFSTYAMYWMKAELFSMFEKNAYGSVIIGNDRRYDANKRAAAGNDRVDDYKIFPRHVSWERINTSTEDENSQEGLLLSNGAYTPSTTERDLIHHDLYHKVMGVMEEVLDDKEKGIVLSLSNGETLQSLGDKLGVSRERVRQISVKAFAKVRLKATELGMN